MLSLALLADLVDGRTEDTVVGDGIHIVGALDRGVRGRPLKPAFTLLAGKFQTAIARHNRFRFRDLVGTREQLAQGANADIFASATAPRWTPWSRPNPTTTTRSTRVQHAGILTTPGDPKQVRSFADLAKPDLRVAVCQESHPADPPRNASRTTPECISTRSARSRCRLATGKSTSGEADAGLVYLTDAHKAGGKPPRSRFPRRRSSEHLSDRHSQTCVAAGAGQKFVDLVTATGQRVLTQAGFASP